MNPPAGGPVKNAIGDRCRFADGGPKRLLLPLDPFQQFGDILLPDDRRRKGDLSSIVAKRDRAGPEKM